MTVEIKVSPEFLSMGILSFREIEVFLLRIKGLTNQQVAEQLYLEPSTVERLVNNIQHKFDAKYQGGLLRILWGLLENNWLEITCNGRRNN